MYDLTAIESIEGSCDPRTMALLLDEAMRFGSVEEPVTICWDRPCGTQPRLVGLSGALSMTWTLDEDGLEGEVVLIHASGCSERYALVYEYRSSCAWFRTTPTPPDVDPSRMPDASGSY